MKPALSLLLTLSFAAGCRTVDFVIPTGYVGPVVILFDDPLGRDSETHGYLHEVHRVGSDGVLTLKTRFMDGWQRDRFYYVDAAGRRSRIPRSNDRSVSDHDVQIMRVQMEAIPPEPTRLPDGSMTSSTQNGLTALVFVVGRPIDFPNPSRVGDAAAEAVARKEYARIRDLKH